MGRRFSLVVASLMAASLVAAATVAIRVHHTHSYRYTFLLWNLFLAWVPLIAAVLALRLARRGRTLAGLLVVVWLAFFPNAPYVLTDFIHLQRDLGPSPLWYDALMISSFAWTALLLGLVSLYLIHTLIERRAGSAVGWVVVVGALGLASIGVYIGRFAGFNSWDVVVHPRRVLSVVRRQTDSPVHDPKMIAALLALTAALLVAYLVVYAFSALRADELALGANRVVHQDEDRLDVERVGARDA